MLGSCKSNFPIAVSKRIEAAGIVELENLIALAWSLAGEKVGHVVRVEMNLKRLVDCFIPCEELLVHVRYTGRGKESRVQSSCEAMSLMMVFGLMTPGQRSHARHTKLLPWAKRGGFH
jgi:hypothetical protein